MGEAQTNPWVRVDLHRYNNEALELFEPLQMPDYVRIMSRILIADTQFQEAYLEKQAAYAERDQFIQEYGQ
jgi:hypothetical protein